MPVVGRFPLLTCNEGLAEQTVLIIQPIADGRLAYGRHRIHIAGGQTAQAAVAQRRIHLVLQYIGKANLITVEHCLDGIVPAEIKQVIAGQTTQQELRLPGSAPGGRRYYRLAEGSGRVWLMP